MNILGVTLARGGSKGVPGKHTRMLGGKPVLVWTLDAVWQSRLSDYVVSSDDPAILKLAGDSYMPTIVRPPELALDTTPTLPALQHAVTAWEQHQGIVVDYVVELRATAPFKTAQDIDNCIDLLKSTGADSVIGVCQVEDGHPARIKQIVDGRLRDWPGCPEPASGRRQDCQPAAYIRNGSIYAFKRAALFGEKAAIFGHEFSVPYVMPPERSVNIDSEIDWLVCQALAERLSHVA